ncbi:MAG: hypothetical protein INQ03_12035 [Candidatus Heimdallarchaeota archaeon]|nr:hypothetical protein [Candidatus Heimdallarchaeota archaeon]
MPLEDVLNDYTEVYGRPSPIRYPLLQLSDQHRSFDALLRRYWNDLHPLVKDIFTSFANEFQYLLDIIGNIEDKKDEEINELRHEMQKALQTMHTQLDSIKLEHSTELDLKDDQISNLEQEKNNLLDKIIKMEESLESSKTIIKQKDNLIISQKNEITRINKEKNENKISVEAEVISETIANVEIFSNKLDIVEQEMKIIEEEKLQAIEKINSLENQLEKQKEDFELVLKDKNDRLRTLKESLQKIYITTERTKAEKKATEKLNQAQNNRIAILEEQLENMSKEHLLVKKYLEKQIAINKSYHALTLKVIEKTKPKSRVTTDKKSIEKKPVDVPDLLDQINENTAQKSEENIISDSTSKLQEKTIIKQSPSRRVPDEPVLKGRMIDLVKSNASKPVKGDIKSVLRQNLNKLQQDHDSISNSSKLLDKMKKLDEEEPDLKKILRDFPPVPDEKKKQRETA